MTEIQFNGERKTNLLRRPERRNGPKPQPVSNRCQARRSSTIRSATRTGKHLQWCTSSLHLPHLPPPPIPASHPLSLSRSACLTLCITWLPGSAIAPAMTIPCGNIQCYITMVVLSHLRTKLFFAFHAFFSFRGCKNNLFFPGCCSFARFAQR